MNIKNSILILISLLMFANVQAAFVEQSSAETVAKNFYWERINSIYPIDLQDIITESIISEKRNNSIVIYHFNFLNGGFVSISADDAAYPILAYDFNNHIQRENMAPNYSNWINNRADEIAFIQKNNLKASKETIQKWLQLKNSKQLSIFSGKSIAPLMNAKWNQNSKYNAMSPADPNGSGGHAYAGCVAVAMAQIMYYYRYPMHGIGSGSYYSYNYGVLSANYAAATYDYNGMTNSMPSSGNHEIAELLYHCAVAVEMNFSATGSGASPILTEASLKSIFGFQNSLSLQYYSYYTNAQWATKIIDNIDNGIPLFYAGYNSSNTSGHAFNLDGYQGNDFFHFNWGWGGAYNGYFYISSLSPGSSSFTNGQQAIFDIYPASNYPYACTVSDTLKASDGSIYDGSGPSNYQANQDCHWLIQPDGNVDSIFIYFDHFDLGTNDTLFIYDGPDTNSTLIARLSGDTLPTSLSSSDTSLFIRFKTDASIQGTGFGLTYRTVVPVFCAGISHLTQNAASFSDGSQLRNYNNNSQCRWFIHPSNGLPLKLIFTAFDTESNNDILSVYDPTTSPHTLLATYSGNNIPNSIISTSGRMMLIFNTNDNTCKTGWEAHYITGNSIGMDEIDFDKSISIFPNPSDDNLNIHFDIPINEVIISIYTPEGRLVSQQTVTNTQNKISLSTSAFVNGYYFINIQSKKGVFTRAFIIKH